MTNPMTDQEKQLVGALVADILERSSVSGLDWDKACFAAGVAAKSLGVGAHQCGKGDLDECVIQALNQLNAGAQAEVSVIDEIQGYLFTVH